MQTFPICRATSAAWDETPPRDVKIPSAAIMPRKSSGDVSMRASTTFSPFSARCTASLGAENNMAGGRARPGRQDRLPIFFALPRGLAIENWREQMRQLIGRNALHRILFR